jgi:hypothetical protein
MMGLCWALSMDFIAATGAYLGKTNVYKANPDGTHAHVGQFSNFWDKRIGRLLEGGGADSGLLVDQSPVHLNPDDIRLIKRLGMGTYGQAWTCSLPGGDRYVVKFPREIHIKTTAGGEHTIGKRKYKKYDMTKLKKFKSEYSKRHGYNMDALDEFKTEFGNFERLMEPHGYVADFAEGEHFAKGLVKTGLQPAENRGKYREYMEEMLRIKAIPGYAHMHPLYHIAALDGGNLPLIFSMPCEGTLYGYCTWLRDQKEKLMRPKRDGTPSDLWLRLALHLVLAMEFMEARGFVSVDIKCDNVFYKTVLDEGGAPNLHFMIADYGMCTEASFKPSEYKGKEEVLRGPLEYCPAQIYLPEITSAAISKFQIACILEVSTDQKDLKKGDAFSLSLKPSPISQTPYFQTICAIRTSKVDHQIHHYFNGLGRDLRADGILP